MKQYSMLDGRANEVVLKIMKETKSGEMIWNSVQTNITLARNEFICGLVYKSHLNSHAVRLFTIQGSKFRAILELYEENSGNVIYRFPEINMISDLYALVNSGNQSVGSILDEYLKI